MRNNKIDFKKGFPKLKNAINNIKRARDLWRVVRGFVNLHNFYSTFCITFYHNCHFLIFVFKSCTHFSSLNLYNLYLVLTIEKGNRRI